MLALQQGVLVSQQAVLATQRAQVCLGLLRPLPLGVPSTLSFILPQPQRCQNACQPHRLGRPRITLDRQFVVASAERSQSPLQDIMLIQSCRQARRG